MGYFGDLLKKIETVESQGFDPYTESYSARIGKLPTTTDPTTTITTQPKTYTAQEISKSFTEKGLDDPFENIVDATGEINRSSFSTGFNNAKDVGIPQQSYIDVMKATNPDAFNKTFMGEDLKMTASGGLGFEANNKPVEKKLEKNVNYGKYWSNTEHKYVYKRENEKTGEVYEIYDDPKKFKEDSDIYKSKK